ncbi:MAG: XRE family transcriptional regulator [Edaphobacter sp.]
MAIKWSDLKHKSSPERLADRRQQAKAELERIGFDKLRLARQQTQSAVAERLHIPQGAVSRMEKRSDLLLSTLREYINALGGRLELRAVFPDGDFEIEPLAPLKAAKKGPNQITAPSKRTVGSRR